MYIFSWKGSKGYEEISKNGCIHSNGLQLRSCYRPNELHPNECRAQCTLESEWCIGFQITRDFNLRYQREFNKCNLFPSNETFTLCPKGWYTQYASDDNFEMAQAITDLIRDKNGDYGNTCFVNMTGKKHLLHL